MTSKLPSISKFKVGQKVAVGDRESFALYGKIIEIAPKDEFPVKVDINMGSPISLSLVEFDKTWSLVE